MNKWLIFASDNALFTKEYVIRLLGSRHMPLLMLLAVCQQRRVRNALIKRRCMSENLRKRTLQDPPLILICLTSSSRRGPINNKGAFSGPLLWNENRRTIMEVISFISRWMLLDTAPPAKQGKLFFCFPVSLIVAGWLFRERRVVSYAARQFGRSARSRYKNTVFICYSPNVYQSSDPWK